MQSKRSLGDYCSSNRQHIPLQTPYHQQLSSTIQKPKPHYVWITWRWRKPVDTWRPRDYSLCYSFYLQIIIQ